MMKQGKIVMIVIFFIVILIFSRQQEDIVSDKNVLSVSSSCDKNGCESSKKEAICTSYPCEQSCDVTNGAAHAYTTLRYDNVAKICSRREGSTCWVEKGTEYSWSCLGNNEDSYWSEGLNSITCDQYDCQADRWFDDNIIFNRDFPDGFTMACHSSVEKSGYSSWCWVNAYFNNPLAIRVLCDEEIINVGFCKDGAAYQKFQNSDCTETDILIRDCNVDYCDGNVRHYNTLCSLAQCVGGSTEVCEFGCEDGQCFSEASYDNFNRQAKSYLLGDITLNDFITSSNIWINVDKVGTLLYCTSDSDCAGDTCCHADMCVNKDFKEDCSGSGGFPVKCDLGCYQNTLDCGQANCLCVNNACRINIF